MKKLIFLCLIILSGAVIAQPPQSVNVGSAPDAGDGDNLRAAFIKVNTNDAAIYDTLEAFREIIESLLLGVAYIQTENGPNVATVTTNSSGQVIIEATGGVYIEDSIYASKYNCVTRYGYPYFDSITHVMRIDSTLLGASYGLVKPLIPVKELLADTVKGEIAWFPSKDKKVYSFNGLLPNEVNNAFMEKHEYELRYIAELEKRIVELEKQKAPQSRTDVKLYLGLIAFMALLLILAMIRK